MTSVPLRRDNLTGALPGNPIWLEAELVAEPNKVRQTYMHEFKGERTTEPENTRVGMKVPLVRRALEHGCRDIRLVGLRLTCLVSTTSASRETAMRYGLLHAVDVNDLDGDERESSAVAASTGAR